ncbi:MAG: hypothetical protein LBB85_07695 [Dysgonamonadaceae bacterium]|jgi:nicotinamide riboside kinase|nr:hypothetical protein [Dysgonamonadaceae bacterium]
MVESHKDYYEKITDNQVDPILKMYDVDKIIIGHTIVNDISYDFNQKVLRIDVKHGKTKFSGKHSEYASKQTAFIRLMTEGICLIIYLTDVSKFIE